MVDAYFSGVGTRIFVGIGIYEIFVARTMFSREMNLLLKLFVARTMFSRETNLVLKFPTRWLFVRSCRSVRVMLLKLYEMVVGRYNCVLLLFQT
jgi:hypothetical protein